MLDKYQYLKNKASKKIVNDCTNGIIPESLMEQRLDTLELMCVDQLRQHCIREEIKVDRRALID